MTTRPGTIPPMTTRPETTPPMTTRPGTTPPMTTRPGTTPPMTTAPIIPTAQETLSILTNLKNNEAVIVKIQGSNGNYWIENRDSFINCNGNYNNASSIKIQKTSNSNFKLLIDNKNIGINRDNIRLGTNTPEIIFNIDIYNNKIYFIYKSSSDNSYYFIQLKNNNNLELIYQGSASTNYKSIISNYSKEVVSDFLFTLIQQVPLISSESIPPGTTRLNTSTPITKQSVTPTPITK
jgi:hypothetical protein